MNFKRMLVVIVWALAIFAVAAPAFAQEGSGEPKPKSPGRTVSRTSSLPNTGTNSFTTTALSVGVGLVIAGGVILVAGRVRE